MGVDSACSMTVIGKLLNKARSHSTDVAAFSLFALLGLLVTFPVILYPRTSVYARFPGDPHVSLWSVWWAKFSWLSHISYRACPLVAAPFGIRMPRGAEPVLSFPLFLLSLLFGEIFAYNTVAFLGFLVSAVATYFLVYHFTRNRLASILSGIIYAFSPYHFAQSYAHLGLANIQYLPIYVFFLIRFYEQRTLRNALLYGFSFFLVVMENAYYALFMATFTLAFLLFTFVRNIRSGRAFSVSVSAWGLPLLGALFSLVLIAPLILPATLQQATGESTHLTALWEVESLTAKSWSYTIPAPDNPVLGRFVEDFLYTQNNGRYPDEHLDYLGYVPVALSVLAVGVWLSRRRIGFRSDSARRSVDFAVPIFVLMFLVAVISSLPPFLKISGVQIKMPSYYLYSLTPMFRSFARFGIVAMLAVSVLAGIGMKFLLERIGSGKRRVLVTSLIISLVLAEFINVPPSKAEPANPQKIPPVYKWLASQPEEFIIAEYPVPVEMPHKFYEYMFYQRIHRKKLADPRRIPAIQGKDYLYNLLRPGVSNVLRYLGVKYVIVHTEQYRETGGSLITLTKSHGLRMVKTFPNTLVYEVVSLSSEVLWIPEEGFFSPDFWGSWEDYGEGKWMQQNARLRAVVFTGRETYGDVVFKSRALGGPRELELSLNGKQVADVKVSASTSKIVIRDVRLRAGENDVTFSTLSPAEEIDSYLGNGDKRSATLMLSEFKFDN